MGEKPRDYPLPWCDARGAPYWRLNFRMCLFRPGWSEWQRGLPMDEIIPEIDRLIAVAPTPPTGDQS